MYHVFHERMKHIEIYYHFTPDKILTGLIHLTYLPTQSQPADLFTKILPSSYFKHMLFKLGFPDSLPSQSYDPPNFPPGVGVGVRNTSSSLKQPKLPAMQS